MKNLETIYNCKKISFLFNTHNASLCLWCGIYGNFATVSSSCVCDKNLLSSSSLSTQPFLDNNSLLSLPHTFFSRRCYGFFSFRHIEQSITMPLLAEEHEQKTRYRKYHRRNKNVVMNLKHHIAKFVICSNDQ